MIPADHAEADDVALIVQDLQSLGAAHRRQAGDDADLSQGAHVAVSEGDVAALDKVLVRLWVVEAADHGPYGGDGGGDLLRDGGAALIGANGVCVVACHVVRDLGGGGMAVVGVVFICCGGGRCFFDSLEYKGGFWKIRRHIHKVYEFFFFFDKYKVYELMLQ